MLHIPPTNLLLLAAKQEPYQKSLSLDEKYWKNFLEKVRENGLAGRKKKKKKKTERVIGLGRRTREEIVKWNQRTALRSQTGGWEVGGDIRHSRPAFGGKDTDSDSN